MKDQPYCGTARSLGAQGLLLAVGVALTCSGASPANNTDVGSFLLRCSGLKAVLTGKKTADLDDRKNLSWCTGQLSAILENHRGASKGISICIPEGMTDAELLLIVLDELEAQERSARLANVITETLSAWWPCKG